ncbi:hypothetical protein J422_05958 [Methanocaldococcus villosus KIN24-T80]|uniref:Peptidase A24A domain-containing protein n=1 Tax=Methanocaldococcus villosus KIN24-T80 TaxID=1069083 RepID=N6VPG6_9EURY|nr:A24 family peptidase C-terminal domain-containing protein [Methanocaldococcus villosus]ENN95780.1 hypothetical protein J422_05958 [Methanocaldococcus villosus KIN24-T80]
MDILFIVYIINFIILILASLVDIREKIIPHSYVIIMFLINVITGVYYFGFNAIIALISTFILCIILSIGMGGGDVKVFSSLAPIFAYPNSFIFYFPKYMLIIIFLSIILVAIFPIFRIFLRYWKDILFSSLYLVMVIEILYYIIGKFNISFGWIIIWIYIITSIYISRKVPKYKEYTKKIGYLFFIFLLIMFLFDRAYIINNLINMFIYLLEIIFISIFIYAITGAEICFKKHINELKEGDILRDVIIINGDHVEVKNLNIFKRSKLLLNKENKEIIITDGEGLSKEQIERIKSLYNEKKLPDELNVIKTYPFIPFVALSYLLVVLFIYLGVL